MLHVFASLILQNLPFQATSCPDCGDPAIGSGLLQKKAANWACDKIHGFWMDCRDVS